MKKEKVTKNVQQVLTHKEIYIESICRTHIPGASGAAADNVC